MINREFITLGELEKILHLFSNSIDKKNFGQNKMRFQKNFKFYSIDQWLLYREQTWFNIANILHNLMLNQNLIDKKIY